MSSGHAESRLSIVKQVHLFQARLNLLRLFRVKEISDLVQLVLQRKHHRAELLEEVGRSGELDAELAFRSSIPGGNA